jgi:hypothetical protein
MKRKFRGDAALDWILTAAIAILILCAVILGIANGAKSMSVVTGNNISAIQWNSSGASAPWIYTPAATATP